VPPEAMKTLHLQSPVGYELTAACLGRLQKTGTGQAAGWDGGNSRAARCAAQVQSHSDWKGAVILGGTSIGDVALLLTAGVLAGMVGSAGGIASLISYPVLLAVGLGAKPANVADTVAFVASLPGSALGSRPELRGQGLRVSRLAPLSIVGSAAGAVLLLRTPLACSGGSCRSWSLSLRWPCLPSRGFPRG
jgi:hypothetical protein